MGLKSVEQSRLMSDFLSQCGGYVVIDCGLATELERHGADLNDPSWSQMSPHFSSSRQKGLYAIMSSTSRRWSNLYSGNSNSNRWSRTRAPFKSIPQ